MNMEQSVFVVVRSIIWLRQLRFMYMANSGDNHPDIGITSAIKCVSGNMFNRKQQRLSLIFVPYPRQCLKEFKIFSNDKTTI